jgi:hypothetical protein
LSGILNIKIIGKYINDKKYSFIGDKMEKVKDNKSGSDPLMQAASNVADQDTLRCLVYGCGFVRLWRAAKVGNLEKVKYLVGHDFKENRRLGS